MSAFYKGVLVDCSSLARQHVTCWCKYDQIMKLRKLCFYRFLLLKLSMCLFSDMYLFKFVMSSISLPFDWSKRLAYDWTTQEGLNKLPETVRPSLPFDPTYFLLYCSACISIGKDVFCVSTI